MTKRIILSGMMLALLIVAAGCGGGAPEVEMPPGAEVWEPDWWSTPDPDPKTYFYGRQSAVSSAYNESRERAELAARTQVARILETAIKNMQESFFEEAASNGKRFSLDRWVNTTEGLTDQVMKHCRVHPIIKPKTIKLEDGTYRSWVMMEFAKEELVEALDDRMSRDEEMYIEWKHQRSSDLMRERLKQEREMGDR